MNAFVFRQIMDTMPERKRRLFVVVFNGRGWIDRGQPAAALDGKIQLYEFRMLKELERAGLVEIQDGCYRATPEAVTVVRELKRIYR